MYGTGIYDPEEEARLLVGNEDPLSERELALEPASRQRRSLIFSIQATALSLLALAGQWGASAVASLEGFHL
jgi:hypothetical protein